MSTIDICIGNYGSYNAGYLIDHWCSLPIHEDKLAELLASMQKEAQNLTGSPCEEFYVSDYDGIPLGLHYGDVFSEYTSIEHLNMLAHIIELYPNESETVKHALATGADTPDSVIGLMNWIVQADEIPYYGYDAPSCANTPEEKFGWTIANDTSWLDTLVREGIEDYFDYEAYGNANSQYAHLGDEGYVDACQEMPAEDFYTEQELRERFCNDIIY